MKNNAPLKAWCSEHPELFATVRTFLSAVPDDYWWYALGSLFLLSLLILLKAKWVSRRKPTMTWKRKKLLTDQQEFVTTIVKSKKKSLYKEYLAQTVSEHDIWWTVSHQKQRWKFWLFKVPSTQTWIDDLFSRHTYLFDTVSSSDLISDAQTFFCLINHLLKDSSGFSVDSIFT